MAWYIYLAHFFAGAFLANAVPHLVHGLSGHRFQSPFATPSGVGESSALVNVLWGFANLVVGIVLAAAVGPFSGGLIDWVVLFAGALLLSLFSGESFQQGQAGPGWPVRRGRSLRGAPAP